MDKIAAYILYAIGGIMFIIGLAMLTFNGIIPYFTDKIFPIIYIIAGGVTTIAGTTTIIVAKMFDQ